MNTFGRRSIERILECPVCFDVYRNPKHSFCFPCIFRVYSDQAAKPKANRATITCPICKNITPLAPPKEKLKRPLTDAQLGRVIPNNFTLISLLDVHKVAKPKSGDNETRVASTKESPETPKDENADPTACGACAAKASWVCCSCSTRMCNACFPGHLDLPGDHSPFNLHEQSETLEEVSRSADPTPSSSFSTPGESFDELTQKTAELDLTSGRSSPADFLESPSSQKRAAPVLIAIRPDEEEELVSVRLSSSHESLGTDNDALESSDEEAAPEPLPPVPPPRTHRPPVLQMETPEGLPAHPKSLEVLIHPSEDGAKPVKIAVDCQHNIFVSYDRENSGLRKFSRSGQALLRFANFGQILDFSLDRRNARVFLIADSSVLCYCAETGRLLKTLQTPPGSTYTRLAVNRLTFDSLFLLDAAGGCVVSYHLSKERLTGRAGHLPPGEVLALESQPLSGRLFVLCRAGGTALLLSLSAGLGGLAIVPVLSGLLKAPAGLAIDRDFVYVPETADRRLLVLTHDGAEVKPSEDGVCAAQRFAWEPAAVCLGLDGSTYFADAASGAVLVDKQ